MDWESGISRWKLLYREWINNKVLLYSTGNSTQYPEINIMGKNMKKNVFICIISVQQKLTQHCKSTTLQ